MSETPNQETRASGFPNTRWTMVLRANAEETSVATPALDELCRIYRRPLVVALQRKHGFSLHDAEDVTHDFLVWLLKQQHLHCVDAGRGRFRSFLMTYLDGFVSNHRRKLMAEKRGGKAGEHLLVHDTGSDDVPLVEIPDCRTPDEAINRAWAHATLTEAHEALERQYVTAGKGAQFAALQRFLTGTDKPDYEAASVELQMSAGALRVAVHRFRREFREALRNVLKDTVTSEEELAEEMRFVRDAAV